MAGGTFMWTEFLIYENFASASTNAATTLSTDEKRKPIAQEKNCTNNEIIRNEDENELDLENFITPPLFAELRNLTQEIEILSGKIFNEREEEEWLNEDLKDEKMKIAQDLIEISNIFDKIKIKNLWDRLNEVNTNIFFYFFLNFQKFLRFLKHTRICRIIHPPPSRRKQILCFHEGGLFGRA